VSATLSRRRFCAYLAGGATAAALAGCSASAGSAPTEPTPADPGDRGSARFPDGFTWGVATSAYQIEGAVTADGRSPSIWDTFSDRAGAIADGSSGKTACDHYRRWRSDLDLVRSLGVQSYRFSIAWPRVLPAGGGRVNRRGVGFYDRLVDGLLERGISPLATLYHWDLPQVLQDRGGWENRDSAAWFADYAAAVFDVLGDRVDRWLTINEAKIIAQQGYQYGRMAPGKTDPRAAGRVIHHLNLAHGLAVAAFRASAPSGRIGPCLQLAPCYGATDDAAAAADAADVNENTLYLDPLLSGRYPDLGKIDNRVAGGLSDAIRGGDSRIIAAPVDFLGVNYYSPQVVDAQGQPLQPHPVSAAGWQQIYPAGLSDLLIRLHRDYRVGDVVITENGVPDDPADAAEPVADQARVAFLDQHLRAVHRAIAAGCPVSGYYVWSLLDNFEWAAGYTQRWGLVRVDFATQRRTPKASASWLATVARSNRIG
jgi:beta-glucosidase